MVSPSTGKGGFPEILVIDLRRRLQRQGLWDCLLKYSPPLLAFSYLEFSFFTSGLIAVEVMVFSLAAGLGIILGLTCHTGWATASAASVARLIDERVDGRDRFVTLTTINPNLYPSYLVDRLRQEATGLLDRISLKRDFPYRFRRSFFASLIGSLVLVLFSHVFLHTNLNSSPQAISIKELPAMARRFTQSPQLAELGRSLNELESRIREQGLLGEGNEVLVQRLLRQIQKQIAAGGLSGEGHSDLLRQAAGTLRGLAERMETGQGMGGGLNARQSGSIESQGKELTEQGESEGSGSSTVGGKTKHGGEIPVQRRMEKGGRDRADKDRGGKDNLRRADEVGGDTGAVPKAEAQGKGRKGKHEKVPRGDMPERFYKAGETGEKRVEGARFVIVELPETEGPTVVSGAAERGRGLRGPKAPVSDIPLPARSKPEAPREEQRIPLEYRGILR